MPTVLLTAECEMACPWCFAQATMRRYQSRELREMPWENIERVAAFYRRSGVRHMTLLGGEPTRHSRFLDALHFLQSMGIAATVVTHGHIPPTLTDALADARLKAVRYIVNSTRLLDGDDAAQAPVRYALTRLGPQTMLSYTITEGDLAAPGPESLLDRLLLIMRYRLQPHLQLQIAVPAEGNRGYVPFDHYPDLLRLLAAWSDLLRRNRVSHGLDCHAIPLCALRDAPALGLPARVRCTSPMIDIGPDLQVWPCFPSADAHWRLHDFENIAHLTSVVLEHWAHASPRLRQGCAQCADYRAGRCGAGCRGFSWSPEAS